MRRFLWFAALALLVAASGVFAAGVPPFFLLVVGALLVVFVAALQFSISKAAYLAVCAFVLTIAWNGLRFGGGAIANAFFAVATVAVLAYVARERPTVPLPGWLFAAGAGFGFAALIVFIVPPDAGLLNAPLIQARQVLNETGQLVEIARRSDFLTLLQFLLAIIWIPVMLATIGTTNRRVIRLMDLWTIGAVISAAVGVLDYAGLHLAPFPLIGTRSSGLTIHPNYLGLVCVMAIPTAFLWVNRSGRWRLAGIAAVGVLLGGELASGSRAGAVAAVLAVVASLATVPRLRRAIGVVAPIAGMVAIAALISTNVGDQVIDQLRFGEADASAAGSDRQRGQLYDIAADQFSERPLAGTGFGVIQDAHSIYLQLLAAGGVIALVSFFVFIVGMLGSVRHVRAGPARAAAVAAAISILAWLANGVFDSQLADKYLYVVPGLLLALSCVAASSRAPAPLARPAGADGPPLQALHPSSQRLPSPAR